MTRFRKTQSGLFSIRAPVNRGVSSRLLALSLGAFLGLLLFLPLVAAGSTVKVEAGTITHVDVFVNRSAQRWVGFYGLVRPGGNGTLDTDALIRSHSLKPGFNPDQTVFPINVTDSRECVLDREFLFIHNDSDPIRLESLEPAGPKEINPFFGFAGGSSENAGIFFKPAPGLFSPGAGWAVELPSGDTGVSKPFLEYAYRDRVDGRLIFVLPLFFPARASFDGTLANFEMILPRIPSPYYVMFSPRYCVRASAGSATSSSGSSSVSDSSSKSTNSGKPRALAFPSDPKNPAPDAPGSKPPLAPGKPPGQNAPTLTGKPSSDNRPFVPPFDFFNPKDSVQVRKAKEAVFVKALEEHLNNGEEVALSLPSDDALASNGPKSPDLADSGNLPAGAPGLPRSGESNAPSERQTASDQSAPNAGSASAPGASSNAPVASGTSFVPSSVFAQIQNGVTTVHADFSFDFSGPTQIESTFPFSIEDYRSGKASVALEKTNSKISQERRKVLEFAGASQTSFSGLDDLTTSVSETLYFDAAPSSGPLNYRSVGAHETALSWGVTVASGDKYKVQATIQKVIPVTELRKTTAVARLPPGLVRKNGKTLAAPVPSVSLEVKTGGLQLSSWFWMLPLLFLILLMSLVAVRKPWVFNYLRPGARGHLTHYVVERLKR